MYCQTGLLVVERCVGFLVGPGLPVLSLAQPISLPEASVSLIEFRRNACVLLIVLRQPRHRLTVSAITKVVGRAIAR